MYYKIIETDIYIYINFHCKKPGSHNVKILCNSPFSSLNIIGESLLMCYRFWEFHVKLWGSIVCRKRRFSQKTYSEFLVQFAKYFNHFWKHEWVSCRWTISFRKMWVNNSSSHCAFVLINSTRDFYRLAIQTEAGYIETVHTIWKITL